MMKQEEEIIHEQNRISRGGCRQGRAVKEDAEKALKAFVEVVADELIRERRSS